MAPAMKAQERAQDEAAAPHNNDFSNDEIAHKSKVTVVGSGNWGSVAARLIASNTIRLSSFHGIYICLALSISIYLCVIELIVTIQ
jgi:glycerol-3-phosphate dehydrogenase (NAD+)